ncbi:MAG: PIN domain-containing protein [Thermoleophilaceae bacterium]
MAGQFLIDNSAWVRLSDPALPARRAELIADHFEAGEIATCLPFLLEAGYSARAGSDYGELLTELRALPHLVIDEQVEERALDAHQELARVGRHQLPPVDILIAAIADRYGAAILHYDGDYDVIRSKTSLDFESVWLHRRGSL